MHKQKIASNSQIAYCLATVEGFTQERRPHFNAQASAPASPSSSVPRVLWRSAWVQVVRALTELTRAIFCSDVLSLWLALTIRIGWCPHWQGISCALQSPRYGLLYCHFLEARKEGRQAGRKEGRKDDLRVQKFSYLLQPLLIPLSARTSCFTQHTCDSNPCTLRSRLMTEESPLQWLFAPAYCDTVAMAIFFCSIRSNSMLYAYHRHAAELRAPTGILYETARCSSQVMDNAHVR